LGLLQLSESIGRKTSRATFSSDRRPRFACFAANSGAQSAQLHVPRDNSFPRRQLTFFDWADSHSHHAGRVNFHRWRSLVFFGLTLAAFGWTVRAAEPDFAAAHQETIDNLRAFVRVDTSSPPGNETRGAEYLKRILDQAGISNEMLGADPARMNLVARLKGSGKNKPLLLMGHTDVVGVERDKWTVDPFEAVIKDGFLYGRGASDDKCMTTVCLEVMLLLKRLDVPLDRDVIFLAEADEESTSTGINFMIEKHWDKIACEFALNEGGTIVEENGRVKYVGVSTAEKVPRTLFLSAKGVSGHASQPRSDNALVHLAAAVAKIGGGWQPPMRLNDTTRAYFQRLALISNDEEAYLFTHFDDALVGTQVQETFRTTEKYLVENSILRTSISPTVIKSGFRFNVIPADGLATLDVRMLPDENLTELIELLGEQINDSAITITPSEYNNFPATPPSRLDTAMFAALENAQRAVFPDRLVIPIMQTGATDSAFLRAKGVQAYGLGTVADTATGGTRAHGNDERVSIAGVRAFLEFVYHATVEVAAAK
jgi:acetylornithine deacetylase/succinyl-diaminopimelate desuccinylase-like protein